VTSYKSLRDAETTGPPVYIRNQKDVPIFTMVEVRGIEPRSLNSQIKVATCLVFLLSLILKTPVDRIFQDAAFWILSYISRRKRRTSL